MKIFVTLLFLLAPACLRAEPIRVQSGEHDGFSRLVLSGVGTREWVFGRTEQGYVLSLAGVSSGFDVSDVYRMIPRNRISAVWADPESGALNLRIACACHALPYELQPGILVVDVRDGPAPPGSSFELSLTASPVPPLVDAIPARPKRRPGAADGVTGQPAASFPPIGAIATGVSGQSPSLMPTLTAETVDMFSMRDNLLRELSDGSARGVVTLQLPPEPSLAPQPQKTDSSLNGHIRIGEDLGLVVLPGGTDDRRDNLTNDGSACMSGNRFDLAAWGPDGPAISTLGRATHGLVGEFDSPDPVALERAVKYLLHLGFGVEAKGLITAFETPIRDHDLLVALASLVDGAADPNGLFVPMAACDTSAALWAALSVSDLTTLPDLNVKAVLRGFSALPLHLRRHFGPGLADQFLAINDLETARALTAAVGRGGQAADSSVTLAQAKVDHALGETDAAAAELAHVASGNSPDAVQALMLLVETRIENDHVVPPDQIVALGALMQEYRGAEDEPGLARALALAHASAGNFGAAFRMLPDDVETQSEIWSILAEHGSDAALLDFAVVADGVSAPPVSDDARQTLARRLVGIGLPSPAERWLDTPIVALAGSGLTRLDQTDADRLLRAEISVRRKDGAAAVQQLIGQTGEAADRLRARAFEIALQQDQALRQYAALNDQDAMTIAARNARDWQAVVTGPDPLWSAAAGLIKPKSPDPSAPVPGPLARSRALLEESLSARDTLSRLLSAVPTPSRP